MSIQECIVVEPPDAAGVQKLANACFQEHKVLDLMLAGIQEVPPSEPFPVSLTILHFSRPEGNRGPEFIQGSFTDDEGTKHAITVTVGTDPTQQATAGVVTA